PTPANTSCPSLSWRALSTVNSSAAVWLCTLSIIDALSRAGALEQLVDADQAEKLVPRLGAVDELFKISLHTLDRLAVRQTDIMFHVAEHGLVHAVALVRSTSKWQLDNRIDGKEGNFGLIGSAPDLIVGYNSLGREDDLVGGESEIDVHELQAVDLRVAVGIAALHMDQGDIRVEGRYEKDFLPGKRAIHLDRFRPLLKYVRAEHGSDRHERNAHCAGAKPHPHGHVAPF